MKVLFTFSSNNLLFLDSFISFIKFFSFLIGKAFLYSSKIAKISLSVSSFFPLRNLSLREDSVLRIELRLLFSKLSIFNSSFILGKKLFEVLLKTLFESKSLSISFFF